MGRTSTTIFFGVPPGSRYQSLYLCKLSHDLGRLSVSEHIESPAHNIVRLFASLAVFFNLYFPRIEKKNQFQGPPLFVNGEPFSLLYRGRLYTLRQRNVKTDVLLWKRIKCSPSTLHQRNLKTQQSPIILDLHVFEENSLSRFHDDRGYIVFKNLLFQNVFCPHGEIKPALLNSSDLRCVFENLCLRDGLVWSVGQTVEIKMRFRISQAYCGLCLTFCVQNFGERCLECKEVCSLAKQSFILKCFLSCKWSLKKKLGQV